MNIRKWIAKYVVRQHQTNHNTIRLVDFEQLELILKPKSVLYDNILKNYNFYSCFQWTRRIREFKKIDKNKRLADYK